MTSTEENILSGALEEFSKKGFSDTTIDNIALNCGINKVTIFRHFESKANLPQISVLSELLASYVLWYVLE